jgi:hypothetical protein
LLEQLGESLALSPEQFQLLVEEIANNDWLVIRLTLLGTPYLNPRLLETIVRKTRRKDLGYLLQQLQGQGLMTEEIFRWIVEKNPDPQLINYYGKALDKNSPLVNLCLQYLMMGNLLLSDDFQPQPTQIKSIDSVSEGENQYKIVRWVSRPNQGLTVFSNTGSGWLVESDRCRFN